MSEPGGSTASTDPGTDPGADVAAALRARRPVRVGVQLQPQHTDYAGLRRAVAAAEEAGVDLVFNWDHFFPLSGEPEGLHYECWTVLAAWAEATERVQLGALVTCNSYRNPELLADMARTVDHISARDGAPGRLVLGIGAGWFEKDYDEYGYEFGTAGARIADLGAALPRIRSRWARLNPAPTRDIPVLVGGGGERKTLRLVGQHADVWHAFGDAETFSRKSAVLDGWCREAGRDPVDVERSIGVSGDPGATGDDLLARGATLVTVSTSGPAFDLGELRDWLAWRDERNG